MPHNVADKTPPEEPRPIAAAIAGLPMRGIGPAFMGGRIVDIAIHPLHPSTWYVAAGSGGVWRTTNAGITWEPLFDDQPSYSIGCVRIDPSHPEIIWVGTGESVNGRHVAWGDGVYRSIDGGQTWNQMGLGRSEHISDILIDPRNSDVVYVAAEGPLWSSGGERGLYKTADGGQSWERVLFVDDDTGITSAVFAPDDADLITVATYQRRRRVWSFVGGGPGSGIHYSTDAGVTWSEASKGLPKGEMGRIGLATTAAAPALVYATIEAADPKERGFYRSVNRGRTWERRSGYLSGGTGPHYYQKIFASPTNPERVYTADVFIHVTADGGTTFRNMESGKQKHSDNHVIWIDPADAEHLIVGTDAGLYESFDDGGAWRHVSNLPISQFYRVAVDDSLPFANILGGAQDLGTIYGPSRTSNVDGVRNQDWFVPLGADGYNVAFDPSDNQISYMEWQIGNVMRHDRRTMELTDIQPQPGLDDPPERWNWDTPIVISPHRSDRVYVASQRVWRSENRGDSWTPISPDLTTDQNRYELAAGDRVVGVDSLYDNGAMSQYCTISAFMESTIIEGLLYVGTDDGLIHVSEDGGATWRKATRPQGLPEVAFINDIEASRHDPDAVIVVADDHKSGDFVPRMYESLDRGRTWRSIVGDLPEQSILWSIEQDHVKEDLLFVGAEHGVHVSIDRGEHWHKLSNGVPTISFRDLALQRRDDDLVCASFGRGLYVLDDYSPLREITEEALERPSMLFPVRDAWWYIPFRPMQSVDQPTLGSTAFRAPNPPLGATFTYHLSSDIQTMKQARLGVEKTLAESNAHIPFPGWDVLSAEHRDTDPAVLLVVRDDGGEPIRSLPVETTSGIHRATWDLRYLAPDPVMLDTPGFTPPWATPPQGALTTPGKYTVELVHLTSAGVEVLAGPESFSVIPTPAVDAHIGTDEATEFRLATSQLAREVGGTAKQLDLARLRVRHLRAGITTTSDSAALFARLALIHDRLEDLATTFGGDPVREKLAETDHPSPRSLVERVAGSHWDTTAPPTQTQRVSIAVAREAFDVVAPELASVNVDLAELAADLDQLGGPWSLR
ncbi:MAG: photosystem II stability/assembly factor-like uncharacterized protein [Verrucomicrobiales bacterium]|jgi:photosystem II stability/assembly factor-like uncharacterized protein